MTNTDWTPNHTKLRDVLAQLYLDRASAQRIAVQAGMNPAFITFSDNPTNNWHEIVKKADDQGLLIPLIEQALSEFSNNAVLKEALTIFKVRGEASKPPDVSSVNPKPISDPQLRDFINEHFSKRDISDMLLNITETLRQANKISISTDIDIDTFSSTSEPISAIVREMLQYFRRRTWTPFLIEAVKAARPDAFQAKFGE